jgi:hypothetical protein
MPVMAKAMKPADIRRLISMLRSGDNSGGHLGDGHTDQVESGSRKSQWSNLAKRYFREVGARMGLVPVDKSWKKRDPIPEGRFEVYFNPGGPAVAGDVYLNTTRLHVCLSGEAGHGLGMMYRRETKEPRYMGANRWLQVQRLEDINAVVAAFNSIHQAI